VNAAVEAVDNHDGENSEQSSRNEEQGSAPNPSNESVESPLWFFKEKGQKKAVPKNAHRNRDQ
jgi:hypothetical protein